MKIALVEGSSQLKAVGYDEVNRVMAVMFAGGKDVYVYHGVIKRVYDGFEAAESKGSYLAQHIKPNYAFTKLEVPEF